jgi:hypothetical protein
MQAMAQVSEIRADPGGVVHKAHVHVFTLSGRCVTGVSRNAVPDQRSDQRRDLTSGFGDG